MDNRFCLRLNLMERKEMSEIAFQYSRLQHLRFHVERNEEQMFM